MPRTHKNPAARLEDLPNIGKSIAADLRAIGILDSAQLAQRDPLAEYLAQSAAMERRHDPCVLYTLMAARHFLKTGEALRWWTFTEAGKQLLKKIQPHDDDASAKNLREKSR